MDWNLVSMYTMIYYWDAQKRSRSSEGFPRLNGAKCMVVLPFLFLLLNILGDEGKKGFCIFLAYLRNASKLQSNTSYTCVIRISKTNSLTIRVKINVLKTASMNNCSFQTLLEYSILCRKSLKHLLRTKKTTTFFCFYNLWTKNSGRDMEGNQVGYHSCKNRHCARIHYQPMQS